MFTVIWSTITYGKIYFLKGLNEQNENDRKGLKKQKRH